MDDLLLAQRRVLACAAILNERNGDDHEQIGGAAWPGSTRRMAATVAKWWDVRTPEEALSVLRSLDQHGQRHDLAARGAGSAESFLAWDYCRIVSFAGQAHVARLIEADEAWQWMRRAAVALQAAFGSFAELGQSYLRGARGWAGENSDVARETEAAIGKLLCAESGPFRLQWDLPITDVPAPIRKVREVTVAPGASVTAALEEAGESGRVVLLAGEHAGSVSLPFSAEIVAESPGEARIVGGPEGPALRVGPKLSAVIQGVQIQSRRTADEKTLNAVHVHGGFAILEHCDIQGTHHGVAVVGNGDARLTDCHVHDCGKCGIFADPGDLVLTRVQVSRTGAHGVSRASGNEPTILRDLRVTGAAQAALFLAGPVSGEQLALEATGTLGIVAAGSAVLREVTLSSVANRAILVQNGGTLTIGRGAVTGGAAPQVDVIDGRAELFGLTFSGGSGGGFLVQGRGALYAKGCTVDVPEQGGVQLFAGARAALSSCAVRAGWPVVCAGAGASLWLMDGSVESLQGNGVEARDSADVILSDCPVTSPVNAVLVSGATARISRCALTECGGAGVKAEGGAALILEDVEERDNGSPDELAGAAVTSVTGADPVSVTISEVEGREGDFFFRVDPPTAWTDTFRSRGEGPTPPILARALATAAVSEGTRVWGGVDEGGALVFHAQTREVATDLHKFASLVAQYPADLRLLVDRVTFLDRVESWRRPPDKA